MPKHPKTLFMLSLAIAVLVVNALPEPAVAIVTETLKLIPEDTTPGDDFGRSVAVSGGWAVVGAPKADESGAVYVFNAVTGQQIHKFTPGDLAPGDQFGRDIAVSGNLAIIGTSTQDSHGAAYIYDITTGNQINKLVALDAATGDHFGSSVAIHGTIALIGSPYNDVVFDNAGAAYLFDTVSGNQLMKFVAESPDENGNLGEAVAFDGSLVAITAEHINAYPDLLLFDPSTGNQLARVNGTDDAIRGSLAISGDRVLMGNASVFNEATAGLYDVSDINNIITTPIPWPGSYMDGWYFGHDVALSDTAALISTWSTTDISFSGIVHMFDPDTGALLESFRSSDASVDDQFGWSIGLDGQTLIVGAVGFEETDSGAAYLFTIPEPASLTALLIFAPALLRRR